MESISLIDVSSEDDLLFSSPSEENNNKNYKANSVDMGEQIRQVSELSASPKQKRPSSNKCNLRKSLAWDNAFFTSEGVLNHEELEIVNSTFKKTGPETLPSIQEDIRKSTESSTMTDSDAWELENLEEDLFENLRASIQLSVGKFSKALSVATSTKPTNLGTLHQSSNKSEISSHLKMKPPGACKRTVINKQLAAENSKANLPRMQGVTAGPRDLKSSIKPPRSASRATTVSIVYNKKVAVPESTQMESDRSKSLPGNVLNRQHHVAFKKISGDSCSPSSSGAAGKSPLKTTRKNGGTLDHLSGRTTKSSPKTSQSKIESRNATKPPAMPKSRLRISSSVSPQSSVDSLASESSLSTCTFMKHSNSLRSADADSPSLSSSPSFKVSFDIDEIQPQELQKPPIGKPYIRKEISRAHPQSHCTTEEPAGTHESGKSFAGGNSARNIRCNSEVNSAKPSGLRLPTPKIGYFDPGKSLLQNPSRYSLNGKQKYFPKNTSLDSDTIGARKPDSDKHVAQIIPNPVTFIINAKPATFGEGICDLTCKDLNPSNQTSEEDTLKKFSCLSTEASMENYLHSPMRSTGKENSFSLDQNFSKVKSELLEQKISSLSLLDQKDLNINLDLLSSSTSPIIYPMS
ncbi:hypothetical protein J5N97_013678 [Dioscorea zingiberensis]|uniref:Uncharacterized protein n=1 Tax=Dioscorea zingiberensis TaxID=325984 RepID=A0A9D5CSE4_9LILI|nr:hypothetical protein J5N97_013678 [Dioscorea zingiberensis]